MMKRTNILLLALLVLMAGSGRLVNQGVNKLMGQPKTQAGQPSNTLGNGGLGNDIGAVENANDGYEKIGDYYFLLGSKDEYPYIEERNASHSVTGFYPIKGSVQDVYAKPYYFTAAILENSGKSVKQDFIVTDKEIVPFFKKQLTFNYSKGVVIKPKYLVIHETANKSVGADANAHYRYWSTNPTAEASTHFVVDSKQIYQMLELNQMAWHVGDNKGFSGIYNTNSIGIEVAVNADGDFQLARDNAIALSIAIMKYLDMDISQLKRHYDASGKNCPTNMLVEPDLWHDFVARVDLGLSL